MKILMIWYILGQVLRLEGILILVSCIISVIYWETQGVVYLLVGLGTVGVGHLLCRNKPENTVFYLKEGCVATAICWIVMSFIGSLPFYFTGEIPSFTDALFETISGFTTTGASILSDVEVLSHTAIFWRSFTHWIGGMGVLVFVLAVIPMSGGSNINLLRAESTGPSVGKLVPKMRHTARWLYLIYIGLTIIEFLLLLLGKMPWFDAITITFGTTGTGGFGIKNDSMGSYSAYCQWVVAIFLILCGINFNMYYLLLYRKFKQAFSMEEVRNYLLIILAATGIIFLDIVRTCNGAFEALTHAIFQVASIITTAGFSTVDFDQWAQTSKFVLVLLMFIGACAGSTGGGVKVSRITIMFKNMLRELKMYIHPKSIQKIKFEGRVVEESILHSVSVYLITFVLLFTLSMFLICLEGRDLLTSFTAVAATLNNIGPGLAMVGPTQNFGFMTGFSKWVLMFDMLAGRLELFPMLILFHPRIWKDARRKHYVEKIHS
ncbi:MAG: TrkH family potassium uptake protein [Firmicutes bacterium]|nr:TrkH family potassium uptake protein [Bacillota bacterium]